MNKDFSKCISQQIKFVDNYINKFYVCNRINWDSVAIVFAYKCFLYLIYSFATESKSWLITIRNFISFNFSSLYTKNVTYIIYSIDTGFYYIGSTKRFLFIRFQDHIRNSKAKFGFETRRTKFYNFMTKFGRQKWSIAILNHDVYDFRNMEKAFIKLLYPKLNTVHMKYHKFSFVSNKFLNLNSFIKMKRVLAHNTKPIITYETFLYDDKIFCDLLQLLRFSSFKNISCIKLPGNFSYSNWKRLKKIFNLQGFIIFKNHIAKFNDIKTLQFYLNLLINETTKIQFSCIEKIISLTPKKTMHKLVTCRSKLNDYVDELSDKEIWLCFKFVKQLTVFSRYNNIVKYRLRYMLKRRFFFFFPKAIIIKVHFTPFFSKRNIKDIFISHVNSIKSNYLFMRLLKNITKVVFRKRDNIGKMLHNHIQFCKEIKSLTCSCSCISCEERRITITSPLDTPVNNNFVINVGNYKQKRDVVIAINHAIKRVKIHKEIDIHDIQCIKHNNINPNKYHLHIYNQVLDIIKQNQCRVLSPLDKNTGASISFCPVKFLSSTLKMFNWKNNDSYYKLCNMNQQDIFKIWIHEFHNCEAATQLGNFNHKGYIPYAYAIPKDKDTSRFRPVVSYFKHPLKLIYNRAARGLLFILQYAEVGNMLIKCQDLIKKIEAFTFNNSKQLFMYTFDIKDMYTNLEHNIIIKHVEWLLDFVLSKSRRKIICIPKFGKDKVCWGRSFNPNKSSHIQFIDLVNIVKLDIKNCYMRLGNYILQQIVGIPMGSPLSAVLAILCCCIAEYNWQISLKQRNIFDHIFLTRYVDDGLIIIKQNKDNKLLRNKIIDDLFQKYPKKLRLIIEQQGKHVHFLENKLLVNNSSITIQHYNKNIEHLPFWKLKKLNLIDFNTFAPLSQKLGTVIGSFVRVRRMSNNNTSAILDIFNIIIEFMFLHYPIKILRKALLHLFNRSKDPFWMLMFLGLLHDFSF